MTWRAMVMDSWKINGSIDFNSGDDWKLEDATENHSMTWQLDYEKYILRIMNESKLWVT
jgi:hypothetical protein